VSAPVGRWQVLIEYVSLAAEVFTGLVIGLLIMVLVLTLNPWLVATGHQ
jgi:hypothetical protein